MGSLPQPFPWPACQGMFYAVILVFPLRFADNLQFCPPHRLILVCRKNVAHEASCHMSLAMSNLWTLFRVFALSCLLDRQACFAAVRLEKRRYSLLIRQPLHCLVVCFFVAISNPLIQSLLHVARQGSVTLKTKRAPRLFRTVTRQALIAPEFPNIEF